MLQLVILFVVSALACGLLTYVSRKQRQVKILQDTLTQRLSDMAMRQEQVAKDQLARASQDADEVLARQRVRVERDMLLVVLSRLGVIVDFKWTDWDLAVDVHVPDGLKDPNLHTQERVH